MPRATGSGQLHPVAGLPAVADREAVAECLRQAAGQLAAAVGEHRLGVRVVEERLAEVRGVEERVVLVAPRDDALRELGVDAQVGRVEVVLATVGLGDPERVAVVLGEEAQLGCGHARFAPTMNPLLPTVMAILTGLPWNITS